eukprot:CAMPEP_0172666832 /NCGR_PEP_ID=MMETSP1074-20121228/8054_1 /TAXON_ID=2916 /ORGANISM="Ceratium fusus, Strain PA161109" /LENGTH=117 /DNA_ID=CAMNT_0013483265 /DNA_START=174 /DNA_END=527 /DNA_ORIENTATION=-
MPELGPKADCVEKLHSSSCESTGCNALVDAIHSGDLAVVASLMLARADPTQVANSGVCPLDVKSNVNTHALICALAPHTCKRAPDLVLLERAMEALPEELRDRFEEAMYAGDRKFAI